MPGKKAKTSPPAKADDAKAKAEAETLIPEKTEEGPPPLTLLQEVKANLDQIVKGVETRANGPILRVLRRTNLVRRNLPNADLQRVVKAYVSDQVPFKADVLEAINELEDGAKDAESSTGAEELPALATTAAVEAARPAIEIYLTNIVIQNLIKSSKHKSAAELSAVVFAHFSQFNQRHLDVFTAHTVGFLSLAHQHIGNLSSIRALLLKAHRTACLQHNEFGQATLINLLLRNYLHYNLYDQAAKLVTKVRFPENVSLNQYVRYLYYLGRIGCVQLEYTQSYSNLNQAYRKAPQNTAVGFRTAVTKLSIIVQLLMGDIPERSFFSEHSTADAVAPYLELTQAVRFGRLDVFEEVVKKFEAVFRRDGNYNLIQRLRQTVLKIGLRRINKSYSRISFADVAAKLKLDSALDAEYVCAKNIRDGVIKARLDHELGALLSDNQADLYSTSEPQHNFHDRIAFCLEMHDSAVKAMRYPPNAFRTNTGDDAVVDEVDVGEVVEDDDDDE